MQYSNEGKQQELDLDSMCNQNNNNPSDSSNKVEIIEMIEAKDAAVAATQLNNQELTIAAMDSNIEIRRSHMGDSNSYSQRSEELIQTENIKEKSMPRLNYNFDLLIEEHTLYSKYLEKSNDREKAIELTIATLPIKRSRYRTFKERYSFALNKFDRKSFEGKKYLDFCQSLDEAVALGGIKRKVYQNIYKDYTGKKEADNKKDAEFYVYWSGLKFTEKLKIVRLSFNRNEDWIFNFIGANKKQLKKICQLTKVTKEAIAKILNKTSLENKPKDNNKIKYKQPVEETLAFIDRKHEELNISPVQIENYKAKGFKSTFELIEALRAENKPIDDFIDGRSRPPISEEIASKEQISQLLQEQENQLSQKYQQDISDRDRELDEYKDTVIKLKETIKSKDQQIAQNQSEIKRLKEEMSNFNEQLKQHQLESNKKLKQHQQESDEKLKQHQLESDEKLKKAQLESDAKIDAKFAELAKKVSNSGNNSLTRLTVKEINPLSVPGLQVQIVDSEEWKDTFGIVTKQDPQNKKWFVLLELKDNNSKVEIPFDAHQLAIVNFHTNNQTNNNTPKANKERKRAVGFGSLVASK